MISRRHIRLKVMQSLYAFYSKKDISISKSENEMLRTPNFGRKSLNEIKEALNDPNKSGWEKAGAVGSAIVSGIGGFFTGWR